MEERYKMDKLERMKDLITLLNKSSNAYYNTDKPIISDIEYDKLYDELISLEKETNLILSNSPTQNVGYEIKSKLEKVTHSIPLKSLDKTKSIPVLEDFIGDEEVLLMLKGDGLTSEIVHENTKFKQGSTRGNSIIGEDISHNVKIFKGVPLSIDFKGYLKTVGESIITDEDFNAINDKLVEEDKYSNSRNLVAGSVRQLDSSICAKRNVQLLTFGMLECKDIQGNVIEFKTLEEQFEFMKELGFNIIPYVKITKDNIGNLENIIEQLKNLAKNLGIPIDGLVVKFNDIAYGKSLGETNHHPLNALAFKFINTEYETKYIRTEWQVSRTGLVNPVGVFEPVDLDGAMTERATLHNIDYFEALELGKDDIISVARQNEVIPKILDNSTRSNTEIIPFECPVCKGKTEVKKLKTARVLYCMNDNCPSKKIAQIQHYCSRDAMNIMGVSEAIIETFIDKGFIKNITDLYSLDQYKNQIVKLDCFGLRSYNNIIKSIETSKTCKLANLLFAVGIPNVGRGTAKDISKYFKDSIDEFKQAVNDSFNFSQIEDIGDITNKSIYEYFSTDDNILMFSNLVQILDIEKEESTPKTEAKENPFKGKSVYPTGKFSLKKDELKKKLEELGAIVESGYKKSLDMLIAGGDTSKSGKVTKAETDGVKIVSEEYLMQYIN
jgi:DNA ligase (NAD+)